MNQRLKILIISFLIPFILFIYNKNNCKNYQQNYLIDLNFIKETLLENHPAPYLKEHKKDFLETLNNNYQRALESTYLINDFETYKYFLINFVKSFNDGHINVNFNKKDQEKEINLYCKDMHFKINNDELYIKIPTFMIQYDLDISKNMFTEFIENLKQIDIENIKKIIFDLQGNGGGSSTTGEDMLKSLFGENFINLCSYKLWNNVYAYRRISKKNLDKIKEAYSEIKTYYSKDNKMQNWFNEALNEYENTYNQGIDLYEENYNCMLDDFKNINIDEEIINIFKPFEHIKIECLIDKHCASATLDFLDLLKIFPTNIELIGEPTFYDSIFMECLNDKLQSNNGTFIWPSKAYKNRMRQNNQRYYPGILQDQ